MRKTVVVVFMVLAFAVMAFAAPPPTLAKIGYVVAWAESPFDPGSESGPDYTGYVNLKSEVGGVSFNGDDNPPTGESYSTGGAYRPGGVTLVRQTLSESDIWQGAVQRVRVANVYINDDVVVSAILRGSSVDRFYHAVTFYAR